MIKELQTKTFYHTKDREDLRMQRWLDENKYTIEIAGKVTSAYSTNVTRTVIYYKER